MPDDPTPPPEPVEPAPVPTDADPGYDKSGVPTFDSVRERIETRYGTAIGGAELAAETPQGRTVEGQYQGRQRGAAGRPTARSPRRCPATRRTTPEWCARSVWPTGEVPWRAASSSPPQPAPRRSP